MSEKLPSLFAQRPFLTFQQGATLPPPSPSPPPPPPTSSSLVTIPPDFSLFADGFVCRNEYFDPLPFERDIVLDNISLPFPQQPTDKQFSTIFGTYYNQMDTPHQVEDGPHNQSADSRALVLSQKSQAQDDPKNHDQQEQQLADSPNPSTWGTSKPQHSETQRKIPVLGKIAKVGEPTQRIRNAFMKFASANPSIIARMRKGI